jgi:eukaryotic-like serine/threonine-protein kinase
MKSKKHFLIIIILSVSIFTSACSSAIYASTGWNGLATVTETAFLAAGTRVYAIDLNTGSEKWRFPAKENARITFYANPVLTPDEQLIVASYDHKLYSINPSTGSENWVFEGSGNRLVASPLVMQDLIFQPSTDHALYAIDMAGRQAWRQETGGPIWAQPASSPDCGCIYVASMDHSVYSFDSSTGRQIWQSPDLGGAIVGTPAVSDDGLLYVGTFGKEMIALDAGTGNVTWRFGTEDWVWSGPALADGVLYFGDLAGYLYALDAADGTSLWRTQPQNAIVSTPTIVDGRIYLSTEGDTLFIIDTSGEVITSRVVGGMIYASPAVAGETLLITPTNMDTPLLAMNLEGNQKWAFTPVKK